MALLIKLTSNESIVINGAIITPSNGGMQFCIDNHANVIRQRHIIAKKEVTTLLLQIYFEIQTVALSPPSPQHNAQFEVAKKLFQRFLQEDLSHINHPQIKLLQKALDEKNVYRSLAAIRNYEKGLYIH